MHYRRERGCETIEVKLRNAFKAEEKKWELSEAKFESRRVAWHLNSVHVF